jgi:hypothetical protein
MGMTFSIEERSEKFYMLTFFVNATCDCCGAATIRGEFRKKDEAEMFLKALEAKEAGARGQRS